MESIRRFFIPPRDSYFLFGPRGTGKSTLIKQLHQDALVVDLLRPDVYRELSARPERLTNLVDAQPDSRVVVLDEVQRIPELLNVVHTLIVDKGRRQFVLSGSSARKLRRGGVDLMAGRALQRTMHPFMAAELPSFDLASALQHGLVPLVVASVQPSDTLRAYASLYLEQEVAVEGLSRNVGAFARFLEAMTFSHASVLSVATVSRDAQVERRTAATYVDVLEDLLLSFRLPIFTKRAKRHTSVHPKFYFFDAGVFRSLRPTGPLDRPEQIDGHALEGLVAQHLRAWLAYSDSASELFFWRTRSGVEVDFVVYGEVEFWAIEVKNTARVRPEDLAGLRAFMQDYPEAAPILVYRGTDRLKIGEILCLPAEEFLLGIRPNRQLAS